MNPPAVWHQRKYFLCRSFENCGRGHRVAIEYILNFILPFLQGKGFINDTLRSDFHKRFMEKYVK